MGTVARTMALPAMQGSVNTPPAPNPPSWNDKLASGGQDHTRLLKPPRTGSSATGPVGRKRWKAVWLGQEVARVATMPRCP